MKFRHLLFALILSLLSSIALASHDFQDFNPNFHERIDDKYAMKNQLLVAMEPKTDTSSSVRQFTEMLKRKGLNVLKSEII